MSLIDAIWVLGAAAAAISAQPPTESSLPVPSAATAVAVRKRTEVIGRSVLGQPIEAVHLTSSTDDEVRPTLLIIAGIDARHQTGPLIADGLIEAITADPPAAMAFADVVVVPRVNPDGLARFAAEVPRRDEPGNAASRTSPRDDADRDRRVDEDGPLDLNGDGFITQMRVKAPLPAWLRGMQATDVAEPDEPRLMRRADAAKGERGAWAVITEGRDQDGDGLVAEDGKEGVDLACNFPYHWPEFDRGGGPAGPYPLSEPESRALAEFVLARPQIIAVVEYGPNDNLVNTPAGADGKFDETGRLPRSGQVLDEDRPWFDLVTRKYRDITRQTGVGGVTRSFDGSFQGWAYSHAGIAAWVTPGWVRPDLIKSEEKPDEKKDGARKIIDTDEGKWLAASDAGVTAGLAAGFIAWTPWDHPQLGRVEIGGFVPGFRFNPPAAQHARLREEQGRFARELLDHLPRLTIDPPGAERLGERSWRVRTSALNSGLLPTRLNMGVRARRHAPTRWEIDLPPERVLSGSRVQGRDTIAPGERLGGEWVITGDAGSEVTVRLRSPECGDREVRVRLDAAERREEGR